MRPLENGGAEHVSTLNAPCVAYVPGWVWLKMREFPSLLASLLGKMMEYANEFSIFAVLVLFSAKPLDDLERRRNINQKLTIHTQWL